MKMKIDMMSVIGILHTLENQDTPEAKDALLSIKQIFAPLLEMCENCLCAPTYEVDVDTDDATSTQDVEKNKIDWEQRRYELVKDIYTSFIQSHPNYNIQSTQTMHSLMISITRQADYIIKALQQEDLLKWNESLYSTK